MRVDVANYVQNTIVNGVLECRLMHPPVNAMQTEFCRELADHFENWEQDPQVTAVIVRGNERIFSAGVDLKRLVGEPPEYVDEFFPELTRLFRTAFLFPKPLVTAISGHALAGGCVLASCGDYRLLVPEARIGMPELRVGLALPTEGLEIFRFAVAPQFFSRVVTSGVWFSGERALQAGLADELVGETDIGLRAAQRAAEYGAIPPEVFQMTKLQIRRPTAERFTARNLPENSAVQKLWKSPEIRGAVAQYVRERL